MSYDPIRSGLISINRIIPFTADEVGDATAGGLANVQEYLDRRRKFLGNVATIAERNALSDMVYAPPRPGVLQGEWVFVEAGEDETSPQIDMWNGTEWVTVTGAAPPVPVTYTAFIDEAVGGETSLAKPAGAPAIPDDETTELYIDGRKVRKGADRVFIVAPDGGSVLFAPLQPGQDVELRYQDFGGRRPPRGFTCYTAFIDEAVGGETVLLKPAAAPAIPDDETTELYIDGRKVRKGANRVFMVAPDGGSVLFAPLQPGQDVELRYYGTR